MKTVDPYYHRYVGKVLREVSDAIEADCKKDGYSFSVLDKSFKQNIDVDHKRLNFYVGTDFKITKIFRG